MPHLRLRLYAPVVSLTTEGGTLRQCAVADGYLIDELAVENGPASERPAKAAVIFDELLHSSAGLLKYEARWVDPDSGKMYPGTLRLTLPLSEKLKPFVLRHPFSERPLILGVSVEAHFNGQEVVQHIGPYDGGEYVWNCSVASELPATVEWLTPDIEPQQQPEVQPTPLAPPWQQDAVRGLKATLEASVSAATDVHREVRALRYVVIAIGIGLLIYAAAKAI